MLLWSLVSDATNNALYCSIRYPPSRPTIPAHRGNHTHVGLVFGGGVVGVNLIYFLGAIAHSSAVISPSQAYIVHGPGRMWQSKNALQSWPSARTPSLLCNHSSNNLLRSGLRSATLARSISLSDSASLRAFHAGSACEQPWCDSAYKRHFSCRRLIQAITPNSLSTRGGCFAHCLTKPFPRTRESSARQCHFFMRPRCSGVPMVRVALR